MAKTPPNLDGMDSAEEPESLGTFGLAASDADLAILDKPPIPFSIIGYDVMRGADGTRQSHTFTFHVRPGQEFGPLMRALVKTDSSGNMTVPDAVKFITKAVVPWEQEDFLSTLDDPDLHFRAEILEELAQKLTARYAGRPTLPRSARRAGQRQQHNGRTTAVGR